MWVLILITSILLQKRATTCKPQLPANLSRAAHSREKNQIFCRSSSLSYCFLLMIFAPTPTFLFCNVADRGPDFCPSRISDPLSKMTRSRALFVSDPLALSKFDRNRKKKNISNSRKFLILYTKTIVVNCVADPDLQDTYGPPESGSISQIYGSGSFSLSLSKNSKKNIESYCFVTSL